MTGMAVSRAFPNILVDDLTGTRDFYVALLGMQVTFDSDWFTTLSTGGDPASELGIWRRDHELVPTGFHQSPAGLMLSFVVDDVDAVHADALDRGVPVVEPPRDLFYGQRRLLLCDPSGTLVDICTPTAMSDEFAASLTQDGDTIRQQR
jgi:catechol 2,3-dioxygenase-like lactoylglutathione lyase family enzyme